MPQPRPNPAEEDRQGTLARASAVFEQRIDPASGFSSLVALQALSEGEVITAFRPASVHATPTVWTVQVGHGEHIELWPTHLRYCNHSCDPNCYFDVDAFEFVALRDIAVGDELTFFYPSTEWSMDQPFDCHCGAADCLGAVTGASATAPEVLERYRLSDYITSQLTDRG